MLVLATLVLCFYYMNNYTDSQAIIYFIEMLEKLFQLPPNFQLTLLNS
ncbi:hypothetical protein pb186bvf_016140 [Paramecium bursaria]